MNRKNKLIDFQTHLAQELKDPKFSRWYEHHGRQLDIALQIHKLRTAHQLTQQQLADRLGTTQSNIARIEAGNQNLTIQMLNKIASVFDRKLKVEFRQ